MRIFLSTFKRNLQAIRLVVSETNEDFWKTMKKITKKFIKNRKSQISAQNEENYTGSISGTYKSICKAIWPVVLGFLIFDHFHIFSAHLHIFGNDNFIWTKSHLQSIMHLHTKFQYECAAVLKVFFLQWTDIHTYQVHTFYRWHTQTYTISSHWCTKCELKSWLG